MKIIGHRGAVKYAPENTIASFQKAIELGADAVECDVHLTKDKKLVVHHDYYVNEKLIYTLPLSSIQETSPKIPIFSDVIGVVSGKCALEIELKGSTIETIYAVLKDLEQFSGEMEFTSPHTSLLHTLRRIAPDLMIGYFVQTLPDWMSKELGHKLLLDTMLLSEFDIAHIPIGMLDETLSTSLQEKNILVHAADCNTDEELKKAASCNANQLSTENIERAVALLKNN